MTSRAPSEPGVRVMQHARTSLGTKDVLTEAKRFFLRRNSIYPAYLDREGETYVTFRGQGGEEVAIGVGAEADATSVTGSTYLFDQQIARFFATLPPPVPPVPPVPRD
jgi:hypothetical protein